MAVFTDNFDRADNAALGANWTDAFFFASPPDYFSIATNRARVTQLAGGPNGGARCLGIGAFPDWDISASVRHNATTGAWAGLIARATASDTFYYAIARSDSATVVLRKIVAGSVLQIGSAGITWPADTDKTLRLLLVGTSLKVFFDAVELISVTDSDITADGDCGMYAANGTIGAAGDIDNFSATGNPPTIISDHLIPIHFKYTTDSDLLIPIQFRYLLDVDSVIPIEWGIDGLIRSDHSIPLQYKYRLDSDLVIPITISLPGGIIAEFVIPIQFRQQVESDHIIPILWSLFTDWVKQVGSEAPAWAQQAVSASDVWIKQGSSQSDDWTKVP